MKIAACFLAILYSVVAREISFETPDELDLSKLTPMDLHLEPINPSKPDAVELPGGRIIGGHEVEPNSVPYQAAVLINLSGFCGGSVISTNRVLTAAHCTVNAAFVQVRLGAHAFNNNEASQVRITSTSIINHGSYNQGGFAANDVAVILLPSSVVLNNVISTIPLAPSNAGSFAGEPAFLSGWGRVGASNAVSPVLNAVDLEIISNEECATFYGDNVLDSSICTSGAGTVGACNGDSGGPLVVNVDQKGVRVQLGVVSFGSSNCMGGSPTVYARISYFRDWIATNSGV